MPEMEAYRHKTDQGESEVLFYHSNAANGYMSNFASIPLQYKNKTWPTSEHAYQAFKFESSEMQEKVRQAPTPDASKHFQRKFPDQLRSGWRETKVDLMRDIVYEKFRQNPSFVYLLLSTGAKTLIENTKKDMFWGRGADGTGRNELGKILMEVRSQLSAEIPYNVIMYIDHQKLPPKHRNFDKYVFKELVTNTNHVTYVLGKLEVTSHVAVQFHSECLKDETLSGRYCSCGEEVEIMVSGIKKRGSGILFTFSPLTTVTCWFELCEYILRFYNVKKVILTTRNNEIAQGLKNVGLDVLQHIEDIDDIEN